MNENCHNCILLMRAAGAARRHIEELVIHSRAPNARPPAEKTGLVMERIKVAIEVAGGVRPPVPPPIPEPKNELVREGGPVCGPRVYRWVAFILIAACLYILGSIFWRGIGGG